MFGENPRSYFSKSLICNSNSWQQKWEFVCVFMCVSYKITLRRWGMWCVCVIGWTPSPLPSIFTNLPSCISLCLSLSVSVCLSFVFISLQTVWFIYAFEFPVSICVPHTLTLDTHTLSSTIFTLSRQWQGDTWKHQCTHQCPILIRLH